MTPVQKILVPFDVSDAAKEALSYAADLARRYDAALTLLYVDQPLTYALPEGYAVPSPEELAKILKSFERDLDDARRTALSAGAPRVDAAIRRGHAVAEILRFAEAENIDMIVMGTHGRSGLAHALLGSVAERVLRLAPCPVVTVRTR